MGMTMKERIEAGLLFSDNCEGMPEERMRAKQLMKAYNDTEASEQGYKERLELMEQIFGRKTMAWIEPPFYFCYGTHIKMGDMVYVNVNCSFIDDGEIEIGEGCEFGPGVAIATVSHPVNPKYRPYMYCDKVKLGKNVWVGANASILPGVTIGDNSIIGAGSVVTKDIPANVIAFGNPCKVYREFTEEDMRTYRGGNPINEEEIEAINRLEKEGK